MPTDEPRTPEAALAEGPHRCDGSAEDEIAHVLAIPDGSPDDPGSMEYARWCVERLRLDGWSLVRTPTDGDLTAERAVVASSKTVEQHGHWYDGMPGVWASDADADGYCEQCRPDLEAAWRELEADALASDGRITDQDVKDAIRRHRPLIESAARRTALTASPSPDDAPSVADQLTVDRLYEAIPEDWTPFWQETGNEDARDGFREVSFNRWDFAQAILAALQGSSDVG